MATGTSPDKVLDSTVARAHQHAAGAPRRGIAIRYGKYARSYHGGVLLAAAVILARQ
jgi:hypothetical protein